MAVKKKMKVGLSYDEMAQGGLPDDFDGTITKAVFAPTNYDGKIDHYILAALITYKPDESFGMDEFTQIYSVGDLQFFAPSKDGEEPVDLENGDGEELEGPYVVPTGDRQQLARSSNFGFYLQHLEAAGFTGLSETASLDSLVGLYGHFNQMEMPKRSGIVVQEGENKRAKTLLVLTEVREAPKAAKGKKAAPAAAKAKAKAKAAEEEAEEAADDEESEGGIEAQVGAVIVEALSEADDNTLPKSKLVSIIVKSFSDVKEKAEAVKIVASDKFLSNGEEYGFSYNKKTATVSLG